jgi:hypothetical protein
MIHSFDLRQRLVQLPGGDRRRYDVVAAVDQDGGDVLELAGVAQDLVVSSAAAISGWTRWMFMGALLGWLYLRNLPDRTHGVVELCGELALDFLVLVLQFNAERSYELFVE